MFARADQVQIFAFDLVHHVIHLGKAHHAAHHVAADHVRRNIISKPAVNHEIARIGKDRAVQPRDVTGEIIKPVSARFTGVIKVNA